MLAAVKIAATSSSPQSQLSHNCAHHDFMAGAEMAARTNRPRRRAGKRLTYRYRWFEDAPLRDGEDALRVNFVAVSITDSPKAELATPRW